jgi:hypothetical protein
LALKSKFVSIDENPKIGFKGYRISILKISFYFFPNIKIGYYSFYFINIKFLLEVFDALPKKFILKDFLFLSHTACLFVSFIIFYGYSLYNLHKSLFYSI